MPKVLAGGQQKQIHRQDGTQRLDQLHLNRRQAAETKQPQPPGEGCQARTQGRRWRLTQPLHRGQGPEAKGLTRQLAAQEAIEKGLPGLTGAQGAKAAIDVLTLVPGLQHLRAIKGIVVKRIGDRSGQLPAGQIQTLPQVPLPQPAVQGGGDRITGEGRPLLKYGPNQLVGAPRVLACAREGPWRLLGCRRFLQHQVDQLAQGAGGKRKTHIGHHAAQVGGQLLTQPAAGGPGVHHHPDGLQGGRGRQAQLGRQQLGQMFSPIASVNR